MRSLQLLLRDHWDFVDESVILAWTPEIKSGLFWWSDARHLLASVSLVSPQPDLLFWSDASDQGWGAALLDQFVLGRWLVVERSYSIHLREFRAFRLGLLHFGRHLLGRSIGVFNINTTALSYTHKQRGTFSPALTHKAQLLLRWAVAIGISLVLQFIMRHGT